MFWPKSNLKINNQKAFTLAEVLITLGIIGVVAAMTIPILLNNSQDKALISGLKKELAVISQATAVIASDNGGNLQGLFQSGGSPASDINVDYFAKYIKNSKVCHGNIDSGGCWHKDGTWYDNNGTAANLNGATSSFYGLNSGLALADGSLLITGQGTSNCTLGYMGWENTGMNGGWCPPTCLVLFVDVNGFNKPNRTGKDIFALSINDPGIVWPSVLTENNLGLNCAKKVLLGQTCP